MFLFGIIFFIWLFVSFYKYINPYENLIEDDMQQPIFLNYSTKYRKPYIQNCLNIKNNRIL